MTSDQPCLHVRTPTGRDACMGDDATEAARLVAILAPMAEVVTVAPIDCTAPWGEWTEGK